MLFKIQLVPLHCGGLMGRYRRWESMSSAQRRQYVRHLFFYYLGLILFWPMHIFRVHGAHPLLVTIMRAQKLARSFLDRLRRGGAEHKLNAIDKKLSRREKLVFNVCF